MNLRECYEEFGGNYEEVVARLGGERLIFKYLFKFSEDSSFETLQKALEHQNRQEAFMAAHTLKGICQNLNLDRLLVSVSEMTEILRNNRLPSQELQSNVSRDYRMTICAIEKLKREIEVAG